MKTSTLKRRMPRARITPILTRPPSRTLGWRPFDPARNLIQARRLARSLSPTQFDTAIVKTGRRSDVFPFTIYVREKPLVQARRFRRGLGFGVVPVSRR